MGLGIEMTAACAAAPQRLSIGSAISQRPDRTKVRVRRTAAAQRASILVGPRATHRLGQRYCTQMACRTETNTAGGRHHAGGLFVLRLVGRSWIDQELLTINTGVVSPLSIRCRLRL